MMRDEEEAVQLTRRKLHARRSLLPHPPSAHPPPLRPSLDTNRLVVDPSPFNPSTTATATTTTLADMTKAGELAQLLERVLQIVINVSSTATTSTTASSMLLGNDEGFLGRLSQDEVMQKVIAVASRANSAASEDDSENVQSSNVIKYEIVLTFHCFPILFLRTSIF